MMPSLEPRVTSWPCCGEQGWPQKSGVCPLLPLVGCPGSLISELRLCLYSGKSLLHSHCFLNPFPPRMPQGK